MLLYYLVLTTPGRLRHLTALHWRHCSSDIVSSILSQLAVASSQTLQEIVITGSTLPPDPSACWQGLAAATCLTRLDLSEVQPPLQLTSYDLNKETREQRIINLNSQLRRAAAEQQHQQVVDLFDSLISKGLAASEEQRQQQEHSQQQQQPQGVLLRQYRPDFETIDLYSRSLLWLADQQASTKAQELEKSIQRYSSSSSRSVSCQQADTLLALWGDRGLKLPGWVVYTAAANVYRAEKWHQKVVDLFRRLVDDCPSDQLVKCYRLSVTAASSALDLGDYQTAAE
eukprot:gene11096-11250_t